MSALPFFEIHHLDLRVVTADETDAGTDNDVWFDIGPVGWELLIEDHNQFERGANEVYGLNCSGLDLTTDDVVWLRLQKKGLGGVTGTPEGAWNAWKVARIELIVNKRPGKAPDFVLPVKVDRWLNDGDPVWIKQLRPWSAARRFARTTRLRQNDPLTVDQETIAILTTLQFKLMGVSGWLDTGLSACATGTVLRVAKSTDGLATIDLQLLLLEVMQQGKPRRRYRLDDGHGVNAPRFLRVEYFHVFEPGKTVPSKGDCVRICGKIKWDTDHEGWYEIHPGGHEDVQILSKGACAVAALPRHDKLSLRAAVASDFPKADLSRGLRALDAGLGSADLSVRALIKSAAF